MFGDFQTITSRKLLSQEEYPQRGPRRELSPRPVVTGWVRALHRVHPPANSLCVRAGGSVHPCFQGAGSGAVYLSSTREKAQVGAPKSGALQGNVWQPPSTGCCCGQDGGVGCARKASAATRFLGKLCSASGFVQCSGPLLRMASVSWSQAHPPWDACARRAHPSPQPRPHARTTVPAQLCGDTRKPLL